jgi:hypothetical protein
MLAHELHDMGAFVKVWGSQNAEYGAMSLYAR